MTQRRLLLSIVLPAFLLGFVVPVRCEVSSTLVKGDELSVSGHKEMACIACHTEEPKGRGLKDMTPLLKQDINSLCRKCHEYVRVVKETHHLEPTPYTETELLQEIKNLKLPTSNDAITCVTCHDPHAKSPEEFIRPGYMDLWNRSKWINPHWDENKCSACHLKRPTGRNDLSFKQEGDFIKMCNSCHAEISAQSLIHSVGMVPSEAVKAKIPADFLLSSGGEMTCVTCHELRYQCIKDEFVRKALNPLFFRGGPYSTRTDLCYKCHDSSTYERLNPHDQINDEGEMVKDKCLYCHAEIPNPKVGGIRRVKFQLDSDLRLLCQRCHRDRPHPGGSLIRGTFFHNVKPTKMTGEWKNRSEAEKNVVMPLEPLTGKVFCGTCHNPHERGIQRSIAADKGSDQKKRLRLNEGYDLCETCHGWNKK